MSEAPEPGRPLRFCRFAAVAVGGLLLAAGALARTDRIAAAVVVGGISDLVDTGRRRYEMETVYAELIPGYPEEGTGALEECSVIRWVERLPRATALLLQHGAADENVHPGQVLVLAGRLVETGHTVRLVLFEGGDHGLTGHTEESLRLTRAWLDAWVRDAVRARGPKTPAR